MGKNTQSTETTLGALKAEMAIPRAAASAREQSLLPDADQLFEIAGYGQMRSALDSKREFRVEYVMKFINQISDRNGNVSPALDPGCTECFIESVNKEPIPDGDYVLHFDNDGVHRVRKSSGKWVYLAIP
jgi:hypothetical protein